MRGAGCSWSLLVLVYTLMIGGWEPGRAGMLAVFATFLVGALHKETRPTLRGMVSALESSGRTMLDLIAIVTLAGIVIGALQLSGFTSKLPILLVSLAGESTLLLLVLTAAVSIVLGMSLPTTVVYVTLAILVGPTLGVARDRAAGRPPLPLLLRHALADHASRLPRHLCGSRHREGRLLAHGLGGHALGVVAYVVPFVFVYRPALILQGSTGEIVGTFLTASIGVILLGIGCAGYFYRPLPWWKRAWAWLAAGFLMMPPTLGVALVVADAVGLGLGLALVLVERPTASATPASDGTGAVRT